MAQIANHQETIQPLRGRLAAIYEYLINQDDVENAEKTKQLAQKLENSEFMIAFCGHFSAGKSTMINNLIGENLLPSSPIPTSANLVKVRSGEEYAKVFFKNEKPRVYLAPYDYELVKKYCKDGDQINEIEISHLESKLPPNTMIMDTPGIDSADDAHRIATESALHLADLVFYVMDYNHVQSELNFLFTKQLAEAGKKVFLVINQIDKHNEDEITFHQFQKSVTDSFTSWGVVPSAIFYTSMKKEYSGFNQFFDLQEFIWKHLEKKDDIFTYSIYQSLKKISDDHLQYVRKRNEMNVLPFRQILNDLSVNEQMSYIETYERKKDEIQHNEVLIKKADRDFDNETNQIMKNAYLMPFQTRSLAEAYIEARQPGFKVGFMFGGKKTEIERKERLHRFFEDLIDKIKSQLEWHLREYFLQLLKEYKLNDPQLIGVVQFFTIPFSVEIVVETVKTGARLSGDYVLNYTDDIANEIKRTTRKHSYEFKEFFLNSLKEKISQGNERILQEINNTQKYVNAINELNRNETEIEQEKKALETLLNEDISISKDAFHQLFQNDEEFEVIQGGVFAKESLIKNEVDPSIQQLVSIKSGAEMNSDRLKETAKRLKEASKLVHALPGFKKLAQELDEKATRLENKGFTVALFGAFSAGKSSFANALIGEKILPVSPNPTTAAINKIKPVDQSHPHGMVLVKCKEAYDLLEGINRSLKPFDLSAIDFEDALNKIEFIKLQEGVMEKTHYSFLQAFKNGFKNAQNDLGKIVTTTINQFKDYVANEEKSCFVEWIELYYDCELTRKGITLVDTPGADSINARHTGVAFDYIKNSDAILFVTYYNHAFSKADREFIIQLGRVKDSFDLDKMFFIINAVDLAENEEEKGIVAEYVRDQLTKYGVRNPNLFPLSSMLALQEKVNGERNHSGMNSFEESFYPFITNDLTEIVNASAETELTRMKELMKKLIQSTNEDQSLKDEKRKNLYNQKNKIEEMLRRQSSNSLKDRIFQEAEELVYYIKQRVFLRFGDFFKEAFNPSLLKDDGQNMKKTLQMALDELLEAFGYDFAQEMRATTIRLDRFSKKVISEYQSSLVASIQDINQDLSFSIVEFKHQKEMYFDSAFKNMDKRLFQKAMSTFKNPKSFFEKNEKKLMSEELFQVLHQAAEEYLQGELERVKKHYEIVYQHEVSDLLNQMMGQLEDQILSLSSALNGEVSIEQLEDILEKLK
ncbi:MAG: dynamin family protein [Bacillota bacterium]|nr:dynamin family protein [Bacillota bacterium]